MKDKAEDIGYQILTEEQKKEKERQELKQKYQNRGYQSLSYKEYLQLKTRQSKAKKLSLPAAVRITLSTPIILVACFGVFFIPYILYLIMTGKPAEPKTQEKKPSGDLSYEDLLVKPKAKK